MNFFKKLFGGTDDAADEKQKKESKNFDVLKYDGVKALNSGQAEYAVKCLEYALTLKDDLECRDYLSQAYIRQGELAEAYEQLAKMSEACPDNAPILMRMADVAYMMENYGAMSDACEKALLIDADNPLTYYLYARACHGQGDNTNATAMLTKALTLNAEYDVARLLRGEIYLEENDCANASQDAALLLERVEGNEDVLLLNARICEAEGKHEEAVDFYGKVIDVNPFCVQAFSERAAVRRELGDAAGAEADQKEAEELGANGQQPEESVEQKVKNAYKNNDSFGVFSN